MCRFRIDIKNSTGKATKSTYLYAVQEALKDSNYIPLHCVNDLVDLLNNGVHIVPSAGGATLYYLAYDPLVVDILEGESLCMAIASWIKSISSLFKDCSSDIDEF